MIEIKGDLIDAFSTGEVDVMVHQANCQGVMGSGIAKYIADEYPEHFEDYDNFLKLQEDAIKEVFLDTGREFTTAAHLGGCVVTQVGSEKAIVAILGQDKYGKGVRHTNYAALFRGLVHVATQASQTNKVVGIPKYMGCGLGGGNWEFVSAYIEDLEKCLEVEFKVYEL